MAEKHHVLALLISDGPASGEELDRWLHERVGFLGATRRLVYRSLISLHADGFIRETGEVRGDPRLRAPHQIVYVATAKGVAEHKRWMREPLPPFKLSDLFDFDWVPMSLNRNLEISRLEAEIEVLRKLKDLAAHHLAEMRAGDGTG